MRYPPTMDAYKEGDLSVALFAPSLDQLTSSD
jgi:hypothetical protein